MHSHIKPCGLWYEFDGSWRDWCQSEMPDWIANRWLYRVETDPSCNILRIEGVEQFLLFNQEYLTKTALAVAMEEQGISPSRMERGIEWRRVAERYDGIEINPYLWHFRHNMDTMWYYGWDCASGCLWRPKGTVLELMYRLDGAGDNPIKMPKRRGFRVEA